MQITNFVRSLIFSHQHNANYRHRLYGKAQNWQIVYQYKEDLA
ncbi:hypothetical protein [Nodularia chucula]